VLSVIFSSPSTFVRSGMKNTPTIKALVPTAGIEPARLKQARDFKWDETTVSI
jgi:hypothetical protein